jgi:CobQ-like glutamine amidotransferase family enzyme
MNLYGDMGNVRTLQRRCEWRSIDVQVVPVGVGASELHTFDLLLFGGGQDRDQARIYSDFVLHKKESVRRAIEEGVAMLAVCGGYQLLGHSYNDADGASLDGLHLLDLFTVAGNDRWIGNVLVEADESLQLHPTTLVGFENHGGRTKLGDDLKPLGRTIVGGGNNGDDGGEGVLAGRIVGTYMHGSLLPKNPALADWLLGQSLAHRDGGAPPQLSPLDDSTELIAHRKAEAIAMKEKGRRAVRRRR